MSVEWFETEEYNRPILVVGFEGWFDVAQAATGALTWLADQHDSPTIATIDAEPYFDFTARRPEVRLVNGERRIFWPPNHVRAKRMPEQPHDLLLLAGVEPHMRWRTFSDDIVSIVRRTAAELVITVGALAEAVPHSRPPVVKGSSTNPELAIRLGLEGPTYQGPTGLVGVLHTVLDGAGVPVISLRVGVPHYVAGATNPKAQRAVLENLQRVTGVDTDPASLNESIRDWEKQVNEAVSADPDAASFVRQLEAQVDRRLEEEIPSADDLAAEFEKFLQERRDDD